MDKATGAAIHPYDYDPFIVGYDAENAETMSGQQIREKFRCRHEGRFGIDVPRRK